MSVECYALIEFQESAPIAKLQKFWDSRFNSGKVTNKKLTKATTVVYNLCHLKLVQPVGRNGSVPLPKWEVVEQIVLQDELRFGDKWNTNYYDKKGKIVYTGLVFKYLDDKPTLPILLDKYSLADGDNGEFIHYAETIMKVGSRRVQLNQIRALFPECKSMPLWSAIDYVRNLI